MEWSKLISDRRLGMEEYHDERHQTRSDFQRDYDRLIFSSPFRRLQNKTQVFPLPGSIFVHNRLTHSLEVSSVGRSLGNETAIGLEEKYGKESDIFGNIRDIVAAACLCHDLGNPPFGHSGEKTISTFFSEGAGQYLQELLNEREWGDLIHFEGNANSFRLLTHQFRGRRKGGMAMTYSTLASVVKYPYTSLHANKHGKFGFFESEDEIYRRIAERLGIPELEPGKFARHPLVYIVEAADDICYQIMDIEDAHKLRILSTERVLSLFMNFFEENQQARIMKTISRLDDPNEKVAYLRSIVINSLVVDCARVFIDNEEDMLSGDFKGSLLGKVQPMLHAAYEECSRTAWERIYCAQEVVDIEIAGNRIITYLMEALVEAVMHPERNSSKLLLNLIPGQYDTSAPDVYGRLQSALDFMSGMTDVYALNLYRKLNGHSLPAI